MTTYTTAEMLELVALHFRDAFSSPNYEQWDWSLPLYLIEGVSGWTQSRLEAVVDFYHNGPARCR